METEKFNNPELTQAEYEHYIEYIKTQFLENFDDIDA
jgi:hypothetical protein